ncbi:MAG: DUF484 family protein [Burkholderiales bacterium]
MERIDLNHPITEDDIVNFLVTSPDFFERHADVLSVVTLGSPHGNRAVSLQERQALMLREKIKALEQRMVEMVRNAHENAQIADKLEQWACSLLRAEEPADLPTLVTGGLAERFDVPQVALKLWDVAEPFTDAPFARGASDDAKIFASSLTAPFCGANPGFEVVDWLADRDAAISLALIPLRWQTRAEQKVAAEPDAETGARGTDAPSPSAGPQLLEDGRIDPTLDASHLAAEAGSESQAAVEAASAQAGPAHPACGLLVLASPDAKRFQAGMGTEFLERLADLAGAALSRLKADGD